MPDYSNTIVMIYDGRCPVCTRAARWFGKRVGSDQLRLLPCQDAERDPSLPQIALEDCLKTIHVITPNREVLTGARALAVVLSVTPHWRTIGKMLSVRWISRILESPYLWFAQRRYAISAFLGLTCKNINNDTIESECGKNSKMS